MLTGREPYAEKFNRWLKDIGPRRALSITLTAECGEEIPLPDGRLVRYSELTGHDMTAIREAIARD